MTTYKNTEEQRETKKKMFKDIEIGEYFYSDSLECLCLKLSEDSYICTGNLTFNFSVPSHKMDIYRPVPEDMIVTCVNVAVTWERIYDDNQVDIYF